MTSASSRMRALVFDGPSDTTATSRIADLPTPEPSAGQVSIDVRYAGVNFKDVMARRGDHGYVTAWPFIPGLEVAGTVRAVGPDVQTISPGDRVAAFTGAGGLAEVAIADASLTVCVPAALDLEPAAAAPGVLVSAALLLNDLARVRAGESVLVHGAAGGIGEAVARLARLAAVGRLLGTVGHASRIEAARSAGYDEVLVRGRDGASRIRQANDGCPIDVVLDPQGTTLLDLDLEVVAPGGRIVLFGNATGAALAPLPPVERFFATNATLTGFSLASLASGAPRRVAAALNDVLERLAEGELKLTLTTVDGLQAAPQAQQALAQGRGAGKQVVRL